MKTSPTLPSAPDPSHRLHHVEYVMGTAVSFDINDSSDRTGLGAAVDWLHHVDETFSTYRIDSEISRLGRGEIDLAGASDEVRRVLHLCERLRLETNGAFDAMAVPAPNGTMLDPSGVVKGWAIEHAAQMLESHGHESFLINAGGDIALRGERSPGTPWTIGIRDPHDPCALSITIEAFGPLAVATSATYERGAHIVDPSTGRPVTELASVTVAGTDLALVDAHATAVFVMGEAGLDWLSDRPGYAGIVIRHDGTARAVNSDCL